MRSILHAAAVLLYIVLLFGYPVLVLTGWHKDTLGWPLIAVAAALTGVLGIGLVDRYLKTSARSEK